MLCLAFSERCEQTIVANGCGASPGDRSALGEQSSRFDIATARLACCRACGFIGNTAFRAELTEYGESYDNDQTWSRTGLACRGQGQPSAPKAGGVRRST